MGTTKNKMTDFDATMIAEGVHEAELKETVEAWAHLIKTGLCWKLQGWFGRRANDFIEEGVISKEGEINFDLIEEKTGQDLRD